jgi:hypothetical protein
MGRDRMCLLQAGMCDVVKHEKKLVVRDDMLHIMSPATKQTKFAAYEAPAYEVASLIETQYIEPTQEHHSVADLNRIILAIKDGRFFTEKEYKEIKL